MSIKLQTTDGGKVQEGFTHEYNDCAVRALAIVANVTYAKAHAALKAQGRRDRKGTKTFMLNRAIVACGAKFATISTTDNSYRYSVSYPTLQETIRRYREGRYILITNRHGMALIDGVIHDAGTISGPRSRVRFVYKIELPEPVKETKSVITQAQVNELWERLDRLEAK